MTEETKRPVFLTVICVISWVGSGFAILGQLFTLATSGFRQDYSEFSEEAMEEAMDEISMGAPGFGSFFSNFMGQSMDALQHANEIALIKIIGAIFIITGAILMWKLKKSGFYLFLAGKATIVLGIFIILGASGFAALSIIGPLTLAIAFGIMFGLNLKHME